MDLEKLFKDLEKVQDAFYAGDFSGAKTILYAVMVDVKAAEQSMHQTGLTPRQKEEVLQIIIRALSTGSE